MIALACVLRTATLPFVPLIHGYFLDDDFAYVHEFYRFDWRNVSQLFAGGLVARNLGQQLNEYRPLWLSPDPPEAAGLVVIEGATAGGIPYFVIPFPHAEQSLRLGPYQIERFP